MCQSVFRCEHDVSVNFETQCEGSRAHAVAALCRMHISPRAHLNQHPHFISSLEHQFTNLRCGDLTSRAFDSFARRSIAAR